MIADADVDVDAYPLAAQALPASMPPRGSQPSFAISKDSIANAGATVHPTSVQSPRLLACCHSPCSTMTCGLWPYMVTRGQHLHTLQNIEHLQDPER